jgi:hypothetical protein
MFLLVTMEMKIIFFVALIALVTFVSTVSASCCSGVYVDNYRCSGNWVQELYRYSDSRTEWRNIEYCDYGCSGASCLSQYYNYCSISADVTAPNDVHSRETIYTTITLTNDGGVGAYTDVTAYLCDSDNNNCRMMDCDCASDPRIYINGDSFYSLTCSITESDVGDYRIKVNYDDCQNRGQTIYSDVFSVYSKYVYHKTTSKSVPTINAVFVDDIAVARDTSKRTIEEVSKSQALYQNEVATSGAPIAIIVVIILIVFAGVFAPRVWTGRFRSGKAEVESNSFNSDEKPKKREVKFFSGFASFNWSRKSRNEPEQFTNRKC